MPRASLRLAASNPAQISEGETMTDQADHSARKMIQVESLERCFPDPDGRDQTQIFGEVNFTVHQGESVCLIGHSGCGKTTLLNILAGLDQPTSGVLQAESKEVTGPSLDRAVIFQGHALMP
ncbi:MAG: ATP-binding cassette domain-containing protein, partial [Pseudomonadota bacterium]